MPALENTETLDLVSFSIPALEGTEEYTLGIRELRRRLPGIRRWYENHDALTGPADFLSWSDAAWFLVILNPALIVSDNLLPELRAVTASGHSCALPADPRGVTGGGPLDYASRPGFDRFVARLGNAARRAPYDGREPWLYLISRPALTQLVATFASVSWHNVPVLAGADAICANHAFVHSYADYHQNNRAEMLPLLPADTRTLLDVGGGAGNFALAFQAAGNGKATLLEMNARAAQLAREHGIEVIVGDFSALDASHTYDCVAMLDVLEHIADPLYALRHARQFIRTAGTLLLSVPNVGHWSVVWDLLEGQFDYQPVGILCNTHLRFFTRRSLEQLLNAAGFQVERWDNAKTQAPQAFLELLNVQAAGSDRIDMESLCTESFHVLARRTEWSAPA